MASSDPAAAAVFAAAAAPPDGHGVPDLVPVAEAIMTAAGARWCVISIGDREHLAGVSGAGVPVEVTSAGEVVALLRLDAPASMVREVAAALGPVCANAVAATRLHEQRRAEQAATSALADERLRAAADMDTERRALERDLHDGAQHHLVALGMTVGLLENVLETGGDPQPWLDRLGEQLNTAERSLASTAAGVLPVTLVRSGLVAALNAELDTERLDADELGGRRFPAVVESAVWFTCLEAVNNARKHAAGSAVTVSLRSTARGLAFAVADEGPGFRVTASASGLDHMRARVEAAGGRVEIRSAPGEGTTVSGFVPI
jgi:signal transduction histidine kinase